jgi:hypothetical protein
MRIRFLSVVRDEIREAADYYTPLPDELLVLAVGHQHRHPDFWRDRA